MWEQNVPSTLLLTDKTLWTHFFSVLHMGFIKILNFSTLKYTPIEMYTDQSNLSNTESVTILWLNKLFFLYTNQTTLRKFSIYMFLHNKRVINTTGKKSNKTLEIPIFYYSWHSDWFRNTNLYSSKIILWNHGELFHTWDFQGKNIVINLWSQHYRLRVSGLVDWKQSQSQIIEIKFLVKGKYK